MKNLFHLVATAMLGLSLAGCSHGGISLESIQTAVELGTASVANPVTREREYQIEGTVQVVFAGLNAWKSACKRGTIPKSCKSQIAGVQVYTRQIPPYLEQLREFVDQNDQVNAAVIFNRVTQLIGEAKAQAAARGRTIGI